MKTLIKLLLLLTGASLSSPWTMAGTLTGTQGPAPAAVNLTAEGTLDWVHWGLNTKSDFDHRAGVTSQISDAVTTGTVIQFPDAIVGYTWTNGTPNPSALFSTTGIFIAGLSKAQNKTNGFQFTVTADTTTKVLKVYAGAWNTQIHVEARLSDGSAPAYVDESLDDAGAGAAAVYTVRFAANSAGQTLTIRVYAIALHDPNGNCTLMAASLATPFTGTGNLASSASFLANAEAINLTSEGTLDWAHWGLANATDFNHKSGVSQKISNISNIGSGSPTQIGTIPAYCDWTDGTPTLASSNSSGVSVAGAGNGFQFTVPADTGTRVLRVYVNALSAQVLLEASLSDGSAVPLYDGSFDTTPDLQGPVRVYTIAYAAAAAGQTLTVKCSVAVDEGSGWVSLQAATLQAQSAQTGVLGGGYTVLAVASTVDLTEEGRIDWAHWGLDLPTDVDRKIGGTNVIGDFKIIGLDTSGNPLELEQFGDNFTGYSWTNGTPTLTANSTGTGIYLGQPGNTAGPGLNSGFELTMPADTSIRAFKVYIGAYGCRMHFEATLSDGSAPPFVDESFANPSDGPNRVYTLTYAAASAGQKLTVRYWIITLIDPAGNVTLQSAVVREAAPIVTLLSPINGSIFHPAANGLRFSASTIAPFSIAANQLGLELNGTVLSPSLVVTGTTTARIATYTNLAPNTFYQGRIWAIDNLGHGATNTVDFDTFSTNGGVIVIEAEDYNYSSGQFIDNPVPGSYTNLSGTADIDFSTLNTAVNDYRSTDPLDIEIAAETRPYFIDAGVDNYILTGLGVGDWQNYTRTFPAGNYLAYLRYGSLADQSLELDLVTSDRAQPNQTLSLLGVFDAPHTFNENAYAYVPLTDGSNTVLTISLSGVQTLRLTGADVLPQFGMEADFLMLVPTSARPILSITSSPGQVTVSFPTQTGHTYTLQYKAAFTDPTWQDILPSISGDGTIRSVNQPTSQPRRFFRLHVQ